MSHNHENHDPNKPSENLRDIGESFWGYFVERRRMAIMLGLIFLVTGIFSYNRLPRESEPEVKVPYGIVMTTYPGASPREVSRQVTFKLEQRIKTLEDLKTMTSTSSEGVSQIFVEFDAKADIETSIRKLKDKVDEAKGLLPGDAEDPFVQELSFSGRPVVTFSFFSDLPYEQLLAVVQDVQNEMEKIKGVQSAGITGERQKQVLVSVRERDMLQYGISLRAISQAIRSFHLNSPVGNIEVDNLVYPVRIEADQETAEQVASIPVTTKNGAVIYVGDVADVNEEFREATTLSKVSVNGQPSKPAVSINIVKKTGENIIETVDDAKAVIEQMLASGAIPEGVEYLPINDMSDYVQQDFNRLATNALQSVILIFIILLLALGLKEAFIGGIAIPFTFLVTFTVLQFIGFTLNFLVLFSLILGLGLLVDATIVIMEGMHDYLYERKMSPIDAALSTIKTYRYPLISGMLTTVAAFAPMLMMSGIMGQFFKFIPITVSTVLISSLAIGLFLVPAFAVIFMHKVERRTKENPILKKVRIARRDFIVWLNGHYTNLLEYLLGPRKNRVKMLLVTIVAFISALALPIAGLVKVEGFPLVDLDFMFVDVEAPRGITLDVMVPIVDKVEAIVQKDPNIESYIVNIGMGGEQNTGQLGPNSSSTHLASMTLTFVDKDDRSAKSYELAEGYKAKLRGITEADITVPELRSGPPTGTAVQVLVFGEDYAVLKSISEDIQGKLGELGAQQINDNLDAGTAEFTFDFSDNYEKAVLRSHGLTVADVAQELRMAVYPTKAATIKRGDDEIDINVQRDWGGGYRPPSIDAVRGIPIQTMGGDYVSLGTLNPPRIGASLTSINHNDGEQAITVGADPGVGQVPADILEELVPYLESYSFPVGYSYELTGGNADTEQSFRDLFNAMGVGLLLIFLILIAQFNSFQQPFVILTSLPLSMIGVLYGFFFFGLNVGVATMIGIVALSGIVINDAIVLIDRINSNRRDEGMALREAVMEAGPARLQPIIITSITTVLGILPISFTDPFWLTLGMAIAFGMIFSTVLTLIIIPVFYYSTELRAEKRSKGA